MPFFNQCKTQHHGPYSRGNGTCFNCGRMGHLAQDCPKMSTASVNQAPQHTIANKNLIKQGASSGRGGKRQETGGSQARVYALMHQEVQPSNNTMIGTLMIENLETRVL